MTKIQKTVLTLIKQHGSFRKAESVTGINYSYLHRLAHGEKVDPSDEVLAALGLEKRIIYRTVKAPAHAAA